LCAAVDTTGVCRWPCCFSRQGWSWLAALTCPRPTHTAASATGRRPPCRLRASGVA
jgi:hypothetical protein